jgi:hypothetical protein
VNAAADLEAFTHSDPEMPQNCDEFTQSGSTSLDSTSVGADFH